MRRSIVTVGLIGLSASLMLAGCSSSAESEVTPTVTPAPSETTTVVIAVLAQDACDDYFALDLVRSRINGDTGDLTKKQKKALLSEIQSDTDLMVVSIDSAVIGGRTPRKGSGKCRTNSEQCECGKSEKGD